MVAKLTFFTIAFISKNLMLQLFFAFYYYVLNKFYYTVCKQVMYKINYEKNEIWDFRKKYYI